MKKLISAIDWISIWVGKTFSILMLLVVFAVIYEIIARYVFQAPTQWGTESMIMGCALTYVMGGAWAIQSEKHIKMELFYGKLSSKGKAIIDILTYFFFVLYIGMFLWASAKYSWQSFQLKETSASAWNPPVYPIKIALTIGALLVLLQGTAKFMRNLYLIIKEKNI